MALLDHPFRLQLVEALFEHHISIVWLEITYEGPIPEMLIVHLLRRLNGAVSQNNHLKRVAPCRCLDGHVKEPYEMSMALGARP